MSGFRSRQRQERSTLPRIAAELALNDELVPVNAGVRVKCRFASNVEPGNPPAQVDGLGRAYLEAPQHR